MAIRSLEERKTLEYNTDRDHLVLPEYGRHLQRMANSIKKLEDPEEQRAYIERSIDMIIQLFPESKSVDNYREKLWHDMYYMAGFELKVLPPGGVKPTFEDQMLRPEQLKYPVHHLQFKHYGYNVHLMIQKALGMEDGPIKKEFVDVIGSYMKLAYKTWNKEHFVSDDMIRQDLQSITKGELSIDEDKDLDGLVSSQAKKRFLQTPTPVKSWKNKRKPPMQTKDRRR
ncbi:MAG: DUF4290 domain-containing protein [Saprospiraceae bacterium]|jgi:hypothetical protein|nr:DUF4290 domain-containing protein [Candidatus Brachybacter algidus]MBK8601929.1 DUF4290 domain-containing protein [Candidatus Brachybacter algidus]MBK8749860.1 DUF4290 domain-containing protein [Candidatus Brachybacter algidus]MBK8844131.1 DUF4290 domain-containing protein [Candidatus Brachybacter algidus]